MIILNKKTTLEKYLQKLRNRKVSIVTGFAGGTEYLVNEVLDNGNELELVVGTIGAFSSPKFINTLNRYSRTAAYCRLKVNILRARAFAG